MKNKSICIEKAKQIQEDGLFLASEINNSTKELPNDLELTINSIHKKLLSIIAKLTIQNSK